VIITRLFERLSLEGFQAGLIWRAEPLTFDLLAASSGSQSARTNTKPEYHLLHYRCSEPCLWPSFSHERAALNESRGSGGARRAPLHAQTKGWRNIK
jgi:hypothetical protein